MARLGVGWCVSQPTAYHDGALLLFGLLKKCKTRTEYAEKILNGTKRFEYRKAVPRNESVRTVVIYATMPVGKVVGEFEVGGVLCEKPKDLWKRTKAASGITREFFDSYFDGREQAMAIAVKKPKRYATPKNLKDVSGSLTPPQSFQYLAAEAEV
jgi:predicted transcriptional regulator